MTPSRQHLTRHTLLGAALALACTRADEQPQRAPAHDSAAHTTTPITPPDSFAHDVAGDEKAAIDSPVMDTLRLRIDTLEAQLARAPERDRPPLLLELGRVERQFVVPRDSKYERYAKAHSEEFAYDEVNGIYIYRGRHLRELVSKYPDHELADDAAYELTLLSVGGECEGYIACYISTQWGMVKPFLSQYPTSPYAPQALDRAIEAFDEPLKDVASLRKEPEYFDQKEVRALIASFDSVTTSLPPPLRAKAGAFRATLEERLNAL